LGELRSEEVLVRSRSWRVGRVWWGARVGVGVWGQWMLMRVVVVVREWMRRRRMRRMAGVGE
jgi:polyferredoxin